MNLADATGFDNQADLGPTLGPNQMMVDGRSRQQRWDRRQIKVTVAIGQHEEVNLGIDESVDFGADLVEATLKARSAIVDAVEAGHLRAGEPIRATLLIDVQNLGQLIVVDHREGQHDLATVVRSCLKQVAFWPD